MLDAFLWLLSAIGTLVLFTFGIVFILALSKAIYNEFFKSGKRHEIDYKN